MKKKVIVIGGPTGVGKTAASIKLAKRLNAEIISVDSMQIYKHMDIGSAKISKDEMSGVVHHMIDIIEPTENFSVAQFKEMAEDIIEDISRRGKVPMLVGGTGLYIDSIVCNYDFTEAEKDDEYRNQLEEFSRKNGNDATFKLLQEIDPEAAAKLHPNNLKRVIRALEVYKLTGIPFSQFAVSESSKYDIPYDLSYFVLNMDREALYERINERVDIMMKAGLLEEVKSLSDMGCTSDMQSMKGIGYKELLYYLQGNISLEDAVNIIRQGSRHYAKRQLTWFKKDPRVVWLCKENFTNDDYIVNHILSIIGY